MRSEAIGKTMAIFMVMAMIATGIVLLPAQTTAAELYTVTGTVVDDVTSQPIGGVKVIFDTTPEKNVTTLSTGIFTIYVEPGNYTVTFEKNGYTTDSTTVIWDDFDHANKTLKMGTYSIVPMPTVTGTIKELGTPNVVNDVEVTITGITTVQVTTVNGVFSSPVDATVVDINFKKNGYYDNSIDDATIAPYGETDLGTIYIEKIVPTPTIKVWGVIFEQGSTKTLSNAIVSISAGDEKWITAVSDDVGYFEMLAYPGNFQIKGSLTGYKSSVPVWFNVPSDKSVRKDISLEKTPSETLVIDGTIYETDGTTPIIGADVYLHSVDGQYVNHTTSDGSGDYIMNFYPGVSFILEVKKDDYFTNASVTGITADTTKDVWLKQINDEHKLSGFAYDAVNDSPLEGATVTIYSKEYLYNKVTTTQANGYYEFMVYNSSNFFVAVDLEGYQSVVKNANAIIDDRYLEFDLNPSGKDIVKTTYTFTDWNTIEVARNSIIVVDNVSARLNADRKYGMGPVGLVVNNGDLNADEVQAWANYMRDKGLEKRDTKEFLTLNNTYYQLNTTSYAVTIKGALGPVATGTTLFINSTYRYNLASDLEDPDSYVFKLGFNASYDTEYLDYSNDIILPLTPIKFEMTSNVTETNMVVVTGYNDPITIDPKVYDADSEKITMTIERSFNGTAKAKVLSGLYYILNSTYDNYTAIVARGPSGGSDTKITFSAGDSTDKIGDVNKANFSWDFGDGDVGYGITVEHNYTNVNVDGEVKVKLVITETGGNKTYRNITVFIDSQDPVAGISAVVTDSANISFASNVLTVNEDYAITFSGLKFTDAEGMTGEVIAGAASYDDIESDDKEGIIEKWYWSWGEEDSFDETITKEGSNNITHTYTKPGTYTLNMIATDVVDRESDNATWTVKVLDVTAPTPDFNIKGDTNAVVTEVIENKTYTYNASLSTDNYDELANLTFAWSFNVGGVFTNLTGMTVNFTFTKVGTFNITLNVTDVAGNSDIKTQVMHVNLASRPNVIMRLGTMKFSSNPGTAGKKMTVSVNITNDGQANATAIQTKFYIRNADGSDKEIGTSTTSFLAIGNTTTVSVEWTPSKKGDFSIWANSTCSGEHSSQWWDNKIDDFSVQKITVEEAPWVMPVIIVGIVVVIIVVFFGMRYFMKSGAKEDESGEKKKKR